MCLLLVCAMAMAPTVAKAGGSGAMVMSNVRHERFPTPEVPLCTRVDDMYFRQAVLVGDSVAEGFALHEVIPELTVLSVIGISPRTAATNRLFQHEKKSCTLAEKLAALNPGIVYLWLGSNGVDTKPADMVLEDYDALLNVLLPALPDAVVYLIELTPVKLSAQEKYANFTNARVDAFNEGLREVARRHNVYLLPVNALLKNEKGLLDNEYGAGDGIHLRRPAYEVLATYLYTHTIPLEGI